MKTSVNGQNWTGNISDCDFSNMMFQELTVRNAVVRNSVFTKVEFRNSHLGFQSTYANCKFESCRFHGKYSSLATLYRECEFRNCKFAGIDLFRGTTFEKCLISGNLKNCILNDAHPDIKNNESVFQDCDLSLASFENVNIYGKCVFRNTRLPNSGLRFFGNANDTLIKRASEICRALPPEKTIEANIIFGNTRRGHSCLILDEVFLNSFLSDLDSRALFEEIVMGYEMREYVSH